MKRKREMEHPQADEPQNKRLHLEAAPTTEDQRSVIATLTEGTY